MEMRALAIYSQYDNCGNGKCKWDKDGKCQLDPMHICDFRGDDAACEFEKKMEQWNKERGGWLRGEED